jgi:methionyl-tRNA formyltransferase
MKLGIILTSDSRSKAYIQKICSNSFHLDQVIFMNNNLDEPDYNPDIIYQSKSAKFDISESVKTTLDKNNIHYTKFDFVDINNPKLVEFISHSDIDFFIFTGGGILKKDILTSGPKFIHFHPGIVPNYRGSTCFYYSIINENSCGVTSYLMDEKIDTGNIIYQRKFSKPTHEYIDDVYDAYIRSETLVDVLQNDLIFVNEFTKQNPDVGETYHIIHPVLKHIAILSCL